jgi:hypothetical protein
MSYLKPPREIEDMLQAIKTSEGDDLDSAAESWLERHKERPDDLKIMQSCAPRLYLRFRERFEANKEGIPGPEPDPADIDRVIEFLEKLYEARKPNDMLKGFLDSAVSLRDFCRNPVIVDEPPEETKPEEVEPVVTTHDLVPEDHLSTSLRDGGAGDKDLRAQEELASRETASEMEPIKPDVGEPETREEAVASHTAEEVTDRSDRSPHEGLEPDKAAREAYPWEGGPDENLPESFEERIRIEKDLTEVPPTEAPVEESGEPASAERAGAAPTEEESDREAIHIDLPPLEMEPAPDLREPTVEDAVPQGEEEAATKERPTDLHPWETTPDEEPTGEAAEPPIGRKESDAAPWDLIGTETPEESQPEPEAMDVALEEFLKPAVKEPGEQTEGGHVGAAADRLETTEVEEEPWAPEELEEEPSAEVPHVPYKRGTGRRLLRFLPIVIPAAIAAVVLIMVFGRNGSGTNGGIPKEPIDLVVIVSHEAEVFVDDYYHQSGTQLVFLELSPGAHRVRVQKMGYYTETRNISVDSGKSDTLRIDLRRKD